MRYQGFALGLLTGSVGAYIVLTRLWWPDVRLEQARPLPTAEATLAPAPPPERLATPAEAAVEPAPVGEDPDPAMASILDPQPGPPSAEVVATPLPSPPPETAAVTLPLLRTDIERLRSRDLLVPVQGIERKALRDSFTDDRAGRSHQAIDIMAARGTPVFAVDDGRIEKLFTSRQGGLTVYQFDGAVEYCYYYAHLDRYATDLLEGRMVRRGDVIGYVGSTGNASPQAPHLHFTIFRVGPAKRWWQGTAINPYPVWSLPNGP